MRPTLVVLGVVLGCGAKAVPTIASDSGPEAPVECPVSAVPATSCPAGCDEQEIEVYDPAFDCLLSSGESLCIPRGPRARCLGQLSCRRRGTTLYRVPSACALDGYDLCAGAEDTKILTEDECPAR